MSAALELDGLAKAWDGAPALDGLSLAVDEGELLTVLGPSGSGKSTALRVIAGLEAPDAGTVRVGGRDVTAADPPDRGVAMVFQSFALFPHLSALDNIAFGLRARGTARDQAARRAREVAATLGLSDLLGRRPSELSGGERQRVALARGLAGSPQVLLLDEPLSNLDARLRAEARAEIRRVQEASGVTTIHVTHDQDEALGLGHRVAVLDRGRLQQVGAPDEVYDRPANRFVAGFVGEPPMNLVDAPALGLGPAGLLAGFRAEHVLVGEGEHAAVLERAERTGHEALWWLDAGGVRLVARGPARGPQPAPGTALRVAIDPAGRIWFDAGTGAAVAR